jgi:hypothetical protein
MQLGTENRNKTIAAIVLMVLAIIFVAIRFIPDSPASAKSPTPPIVLPPKTRRIIRVSSGKKSAAKDAISSLDPTLRYDWLKASEDTQYKGAGRNIFRAEVEIPKVIAPVVKNTGPVVPPPPPPPPPINLKFFGFANKPGEARKIFLSQGEDVFIAGEGDIIDRRYRILHITPVSVEVEDVLNNNKQSIPLTQG